MIQLHRPGQLYVLLFVNGLVKIGRGAKAEVRIACHRKEGARHGNPLTTQWVSARLPDAHLAEDGLIKWCQAQPGVVGHGNEWFINLGYEQVVEAASRIAGTSGELVDVAPVLPGPVGPFSLAAVAERAQRPPVGWYALALPGEATP